jgi:membrane fusion protein, multidrug efflux system
MRAKSSYVFIGAVVVLIALYFIVRGLFGGEPEASANETAAAAKTASAARADPTVQVTAVPEAVRSHLVRVRGRTEAARMVVVRSETAGVVARTPAREGAFVGRGAVLCQLSVDARKASLDQAKANLRARELQQQASANLAEKGYRSRTQVLQDQAALDAASATARQAEIALDQINIRAPFAGVFDKRDAEIGAYLAPGQACGTVIELNPILIVGDVPETEAGKISIGASATAKLVSGEAMAGRVRYVARDADPQTRTYHVEIAVPNPSLTARSGLSADVRIEAGAGPAHLVPTSALVLDAAGRQGVRYVQADNKVAFAPVTILDEDPAGIWVSGLTGLTRLITVGQSYVSEGQKVKVATR